MNLETGAESLQNRLYTEKAQIICSHFTHVNPHSLSIQPEPSGDYCCLGPNMTYHVDCGVLNTSTCSLLRGYVMLPYAVFSDQLRPKYTPPQLRPKTLTLLYLIITK